MLRKGIGILSWAVAMILIFTASAYASGYAIIEQSVRGLGTAYAGSAALAEDPSTIFYNPAGLVRLSGKQVDVGLHYIVPKAEYKDEGSTPFRGAPFTGGNGGDAGEPAVVPNLYYSHETSKGVVVGLGVYAPFGLSTKYDETWVGRYHAVESKLTTININPSFAARMNDKWSVGLGFSIEYADALLSQRVDLGLAGALGGNTVATPQGDDAFAEVTGDSWDYGYNVGLLYEPTKQTRFGLAYRSSIHHKLEGEVTYQYKTTLAGLIAQSPNLRSVDGDASAVLNTPETLSLAGYHAFNDKLAILADVTFTNWDRFDEIRIQFSSGASDSVVETRWKDSWRYGLGMIWTPTEKCTGRFGIAYDETPIPSEAYRTPRIPDEDRFWIAFGAAYKFTQSLEINLGYTHIMVDDPAVNRTATGNDLGRGNLKGQWDASVDIFSINANLMF